MGVSGGGVEEGGARKDTKRRLLEELEPFAPKRRSSRVSFFLHVHLWKLHMYIT